MSGMHEVTVTKARKSWSNLIAMAAKGKEITITRRGKPVAKLLPPKVRLTLPPVGHRFPVGGEKD